MTDALHTVLLPLWPALAASCAAGLPFGLLGWREQPAGFWGRLGLLLGVVALAGLAAVTASGRVPGLPGLWLEIGLASLVSYLAGCIIGALCHRIWRRVARRSEPVAPPA